MSVELAPQLEYLAHAAYRAVIDELVYPVGTDMSRQNQCGRLTLAMYNILEQEGIPSRREFHAEGALWHYLLVIKPQGGPSDDDFVVDLNPQHNLNANVPRNGPLIGARTDVMRTLTELDAPAWLVDQRSVGTIALTHSLAVGPPLNW